MQGNQFCEIWFKIIVASTTVVCFDCRYRCIYALFVVYSKKKNSEVSTNIWNLNHKVEQSFLSLAVFHSWHEHYFDDFNDNDNWRTNFKLSTTFLQWSRWRSFRGYSDAIIETSIWLFNSIHCFKVSFINLYQLHCKHNIKILNITSLI